MPLIALCLELLLSFAHHHSSQGAERPTRGPSQGKNPHPSSLGATCRSSAGAKWAVGAARQPEVLQCKARENAPMTSVFFGRVSTGLRVSCGIARAFLFLLSGAIRVNHRCGTWANYFAHETWQTVCSLGDGLRARKGACPQPLKMKMKKKKKIGGAREGGRGRETEREARESDTEGERQRKKERTTGTKMETERRRAKKRRHRG